MENVLIAFTADTGGLDEATKKLQDLTYKEKALVEQMGEIEKKKNTDLYNAKDAAAAEKAQDEYGKSIQRTRKELNETRKTVTDTKKDIEALSEAQKKMPGAVVAETATKSFRTLRRELEEQIKTMEMLGNTGTEEYDRLINEAGRLNDIQGDVSRSIKNIASDTRAFDTIIEGTQLAAGGFSVMQGGLALFGSESEDVQKLMVKLQSAIAITTGLQQIQNAVQRESNIMMAVGALQTKAKTAAEALSTKGTITATVAQKALNIVAAMNPYVLLAVALISVVGALLLFSDRTDKATKKQKEANEIDAIHIEQLERQTQKYKEKANETEKAIQHEINMLKARGAAQSDIAQKERELLVERANNAAQIRGFHYKEIDDLDKNKRKVEELQLALYKMNTAKAEGRKRTTIIVDGKVESVKVNNKDVQDAIQGALDNYEAKVKVAIDAEEGLKDANRALDINAEEQKKKGVERAKSEAIAAAEVKVIEAKKGTQQELSSRIAMIEAQKRVNLQNTELTESGRRLIILKSEKEIQAARDDFRKKELEEDKIHLDSLAAASKNGSDEEFQYKVASVKKQMEVELQERDITEKKKLSIVNKYQSEIEKMTTDFNNKKNTSELNADISRINSHLALAEEGSLEEFNLQIALSEKTEALQRKNAETTITNKEELEAKLSEIEANAKKERSDVTKAYYQREIEFEKEFKLQSIESQKLDLDSRKAQSLGLFNNNAKYRQLEMDALNVERNAANELRKEGIISEEEYQKQITDIKLREKEIQLQAEEEQAEAVKAIAQASFDFMKQLGNSLFDAKKDQLDRELSDLQHFYTTDAEEAKKNKDLKLISEEEMKSRTLEIKRKMAETEKKQALFNAGINMALGITQALASAPPPYNIILAAITAAAAAVQIAAITSKPLPQYAKGRKGGKGEYAKVGELGPEIMWVPEGSAIMPAGDSRRAIGGDQSMFDKWNMPRMDLNTPPMPKVSEYIIDKNKKNRLIVIDYDKLGQSVAKYQKVPKEKSVTVNFDRSGLTIQNGNTTIHNKNQTGHGDI